MQKQSKIMEKKETKTETKTGRELINVLVLSGSFMSVFTAYLTIQNLQSSLNQEAGLGMISLSCLYGCIIVSGILAPFIIRIIGEKRILAFSFFSHVIYTGTNFYPTFATLIPSSVLLGVTAGPMWTSQCVYLADQAFAYAGRTGEDPAVTLTKYNGIFFAMFETTQITGNLISSLILQQGEYNSDNVTNSDILKLCGSHDCPNEANATTIEEPDRNTVYILLGIYMFFDCIGVFLTVFFLPPLDKGPEEKQIGVFQSVASCGRELMKIDLALLVPLFMFMAMEQGIIWTDFTKSFISCPFGIQYIGFVMAAYGCSTTFFALTLSRLAKYIPRHVMCAVAGAIDLGTFIALYFWTPGANDLTAIFIIPVVWGMCEGIWQTQSNALVAELFEDRTEAAFANYHSWKATGFSITFMFSRYLCVSSKLIVAISLGVVALSGYTVVEIRYKRRTKVGALRHELEVKQ